MNDNLRIVNKDTEGLNITAKKPAINKYYRE